MSRLNQCYNLPDSQIKEIWGEQVPILFSSMEKELNAIRSSVAISDVSHITIIRLSGSDAFNILNRIVPCDLNLRTNKIKQTIFILNESLQYTDVYICKETSSYLLMIKGETPEKIVEWIGKYKSKNEDISIELLNKTHSQITLNGPFAWELLSEIEDPEIISLPYLSFYYPDQNSIILRCGETGEFGYSLIYPHETASRKWQDALKNGSEFDLEMAGIDALEYCSLENNFFNVRKEGSIGANPIELQLQWRISYHKRFIYDQILHEIKNKPLNRRLTAVFSPEPIYENEAIYFDQQKIGFVVNSNKFFSGKGYIGLAMLELPFAQSGIRYYQINSESRQLDLQTVSPPFVNNYSLVVNPQVHSYTEKNDIKFPPLNAISYGRQ